MVMNHLRRQHDWDSIVAKVQANNTIPRAKRNQLIGVINNITKGTYAPFNVLTAPDK